MEITEVRIKLMEEPGERLKAFCSITFDNCFVVRDLKIIEGTSGPFVAMPSRKLTSHCPRCRSKNHLRAQHCNQCGNSLSPDRMPQDNEGRAKLYADIAHPINSACREMIQKHVIEEFEIEIQRAQDPEYVSRYDDFDVDYEEPATPRTPERRFDNAHGKAEPSSQTRGGKPAKRPSSSAVPASESSDIAPPTAPQAGTDGDFGAGIFPDN